MMQQPSFSEQLKQQAIPIMTNINHHPFVTGIRDGYVPKTALLKYVQQDEQYLKGFIATYQSLVDNLNDAQETQLMKNTETEIGHEHSPHEMFCEIARVDYEQQSNKPVGKITKGYLNHMQSSADSGSLLNTLAALTPCPWTYSVLVKQMIIEGKTGKNNPFTEWIEFYGKTNSEDIDMSKHFFNRIDQLASKATTDELCQAEAYFLDSCQWELEFWEQAYPQK
ncbi:TenA family protein [Fructilactobacillus lindneri]|uniref:Aminopyrimidine aminohydrolase n=2 Tax=Fructilactobacillus lindneri TaxID=53444 RepID=A0A0R2K1F5_9LACO|nr:TenA family protein [Fructilactobacillus lindneri]KRN79997.1 transcription activator [Fructilactobacillus lindneri DSM 20690 = JCM 11027]